MAKKKIVNTEAKRVESEKFANRFSRMFDRECPEFEDSANGQSEFLKWRGWYLEPYLKSIDVVINVKNAENVLTDMMVKMEFDPLAAALYLWDWGHGKLVGRRLENWQLGIYWELTKHLALIETRHQPFRYAVASGHGIGKSAFMSQLNIVLMSTRSRTRIIVTANTEGQLRNKTWPELAKWHGLALTAHWFRYTKTALIVKDFRFEENWRADAVTWSLTNTDAFAGAHNQGERLIEQFDEASQIPQEIFEVTEGAMSDTGTQLVWLAFGNPTQLSGPFYDCFHKPKSRWRTKQIDSRTVTLTNKAELAAMVDEWGEDSDFVRVRIRGMFPRSSINQAILSEWIASARKRVFRSKTDWNHAPVIVGIDGSWTGDDPLEVYLRQGNFVRHVLTIPRNDNDVITAGDIVARVRTMHEYPVDAWILDQGYGTGIYSALKAMGFKGVYLVPFGSKAPEVGYANMRTWIWRQMGIWLRDGAVLDNDDTELEQELAFPEMHTVMSGTRAGWMILESKKDMKVRGIRSPNRADALAVTFAIPIQKRSGGFDYPALTAAGLALPNYGSTVPIANMEHAVKSIYGFNRY